MNNIDESRENQEQRAGQEYRGSFRRRSPSPRQVCTSLDSEHDRLTAMEEQMVFFPKEYLWLKRTTSKANGGAGKTNF
jgi:hypothetical protein